MGRTDDAREIVARLRMMAAPVTPDVSHFRSAAHRDLLLSGLRLIADGQGR